MRLSFLNFLLLSATVSSVAAYIIVNPKQRQPRLVLRATTSDSTNDAGAPIVPDWFYPMDDDYDDLNDQLTKGCGGSYMNSLRVPSTQTLSNGSHDHQPLATQRGSSCGGSHMNSVGALKVDNNNNKDNGSNKNGSPAPALDNVCGGTYMNSVGTLAASDNKKNGLNNQAAPASSDSNNGCGGTYMNSVGALASDLTNTNVPLHQEWITPDNLQEDTVVRQTITPLRDRYNRQYEQSLQKQQQNQQKRNGFSVATRNGKENGNVQRKSGKQTQPPTVPATLNPDQSKIWPTPDEQDM